MTIRSTAWGVLLPGLMVGAHLVWYGLMNDRVLETWLGTMAVISSLLGLLSVELWVRAEDVYREKTIARRLRNF